MYDSLNSLKHFIIMLMVMISFPAINSYSQTEILIQAESADTIKTGTVDNNDQGFTGTGFVNLDNKLGTYVVWLVNLPSAGTYNVTVRYANGSTDRTMNIYVNHVLKKLNFNFVSTGSWTTWQTVSFQLDFVKGLNHLKFSGATSNSGPSLDYIRLTGNDTPPVSPADWSVEMANMIVNTMSTHMNWDYTVGLLLEGVLRVYKRTKDQRYITFIKEWAQYHISSDGTIDNNLNSLDNMMPGFTIMHLYRETGIERFKLAANKIKERLKNTYPRTPDGCYWHMTNLEGELWLDGLYMGMPFLATYGKMIGDQTYAYTEAIKQFKLHINYLKDTNTGLLLHAYDYDGSASWATSGKRSPWAWGRAIGWVTMGLSEILDIIPEGFPQRSDIVEQYKSLLKALVKYQDPETGLWYQVVDHQNDASNWRETSCSMMFVYSLDRAIQKGFLDASYQKYVTLGYNGVLTKISQDADKMVYLKDICGGTSVSADIQYYYNRPRNTNDNHGLGTFLIMNELVKYDNLPWLGGSTVPMLSIEPSSVTLTQESGAKSTFNVTSNTTWNATENADWFSLSSSSGTGNGTVTVTTSSANTSANSRSANVTFSATGVSSISVTVTQSGASPTLSVTPSIVNVAASSGAKGTITITSNTAWTASENADWFSLSSSGGTGNGTITVTTSSPNTSANSRSANVTFSATGVSSVTVTVTQSGAGSTLSVTPSIVNVAASSGATGTITITSNTAWTASENADWFNLSSSSGTGNGTITVTTSGANTSANSRSANVTFSATGVSSVTVTVTQSGAATLSVTPSNVNVAASSGAKGTITITSNTDWTASENAGWFNLSSSSGNGNGYITITTTSANTSANPRSSNVTFSATGVNPVIVTVTQSGAGNPTLSVEPSSITVEALAKAQATFNISSNTGWNVKTDADWIKLLSTSGLGNESITVETTSANPLTIPRTAIITIEAIFPNIVFVKVIQSGSDPTLSVKPLTITVEATAKAQATFNITSNTSWTVTKDKDSGWLNLLSSSGTGDGSITVETTSANPMAVARTAEITIEAKDIPSKVVEVIQSGTAALAVTPSNLDVAASSGAKGTITITSNTDWTASENADWLSLSSSSGTGSGTVTATTTSANTSANTRSASVTISANGANPFTVTVTQAAAIPTSVYEITGAGIRIFPNPVTGVLTIDCKDNSFRYFNIISPGGFIISKEKTVGNLQQIDFSKYGKGIYILEFVGSEGETQRIKVVHY